jgi:hypothetical protein
MWRHVQANVGRYASAINGSRIVGGDGIHVASITRKADKSIYQKLADAHLIAAAPDMLDALRQWKLAQENKDAVEIVNAQFSRDAAIAKAEGR